MIRHWLVRLKWLVAIAAAISMLDIWQGSWWGVAAEVAFVVCAYLATGGGDIAVWRMHKREEKERLAGERDYRIEMVVEPPRDLFESIQRQMDMQGIVARPGMTLRYNSMGNLEVVPSAEVIAPVRARCDDGAHEWVGWYDERDRMFRRRCDICLETEQRHYEDVAARRDNAIWMPADNPVQPIEMEYPHQCTRCGMRVSSLHVTVERGDLCQTCYDITTAPQPTSVVHSCTRCGAPSGDLPDRLCSGCSAYVQRVARTIRPGQITIPGRRKINLDSD